MKTFHIYHPSGISATISNFGATLRSLSVPDRDGKFANILLGFEDESQWLDNKYYFGSTVGRYANRIAGGKFSIDGTNYQLSINNEPNHLHGGFKGFDKVVWETEAISENSIILTHLSPDGDEGYPGNLQVRIEYTLSKNTLTWIATATTDKPTIVNLTNHAYFNLTGNPNQSALDHILQINASKYLPTDSTNIPTGEQRNVSGSAFDFLNPTSIRANLQKTDASFDHNFILDPQTPSPAVICSEQIFGRIMHLFTDQPGLQFYLHSDSANQYSAFCLEPQKYPDSPNHPAFPSPILRPGETYSHTISLHFPKPL